MYRNGFSIIIEMRSSLSCTGMVIRRSFSIAGKMCGGKVHLYGIYFCNVELKSAIKFLKKLLKNQYVQAVLRGLRHCITGIILATGIFMILQHSLGSFSALSVDTTAIIMTIVLGAVYFGSRKVLKNGISPIGLIGISALAGLIAYGF